MKKFTMLSLALSVATLAALATSVSADHPRNDRDRNRDRSYGSWQGETRARDLTGTWRLDSRRGEQAGRWNDGYGRNDEMRGFRGAPASLPEVIRIERARGELRVENPNGRLLRLIETGRRGDRNGNRFEVESTVRGARITEIFSLQKNGRELVVRTIVEGRRGSRQFTSVYDRA